MARGGGQQGQRGAGRAGDEKLKTGHGRDSCGDGSMFPAYRQYAVGPAADARGKSILRGASAGPVRAYSKVGKCRRGDGRWGVPGQLEPVPGTAREPFRARRWGLGTGGSSWSVDSANGDTPSPARATAGTQPGRPSSGMARRRMTRSRRLAVSSRRHLRGEALEPNPRALRVVRQTQLNRSAVARARVADQCIALDAQRSCHNSAANAA